MFGSRRQESVRSAASDCQLPRKDRRLEAKGFGLCKSWRIEIEHRQKLPFGLMDAPVQVGMFRVTDSSAGRNYRLFPIGNWTEAKL
jgi:hypothetical protein